MTLGIFPVALTLYHGNEGNVEFLNDLTAKSIDWTTLEISPKSHDMPFVRGDFRRSRTSSNRVD
jgi:hypothetical protein